MRRSGVAITGKRATPLRDGRVNLISDFCGELFCLIYHFLDFSNGGYTFGAMFLFVDFLHGLHEVFGISASKFLHGVDTGSFEEFGKLGTYAIDAEQVGMIHPSQNKVVTDTGGIFQFFPSFRSFAFFKKLGNLFNSGGNQLFSINGAHALDVDDLIIHD